MKKKSGSRYAVKKAAVWAVLLAGLLGLAVWAKPPVGETGRTGSAKPGARIYTSVSPAGGEYRRLSLRESDIFQGELLLVNEAHPYQFGEEPALVSVFDEKNSSYNVKDTKVSVARTAMGALNRMLDDFYKETGNQTINVISGHRTYALQQTLLDEKIAEKGAVEAVKWVALPGASEHHTGLAVDFSIFHRKTGRSEPYKGKGDYAWINENAYKYGYIVRYPDEKKEITGIDYEPWHFRYLGLPHAYLVTRQGLCYEEYIDFLRQFEYGEKHLKVEYDGKTYEIYYTKNTDVYVPKNEEYSVSGNNVDGFIVTVIKDS